jgi:quercetin dioxygenase-like cupin family protein
MIQQTLEQFTTTMTASGYDEVLVREWGPGHVAPEHEHPFDTNALVVQGEFWLTVGDTTRHLRAGDTFQLAHGIRHAEKYGAEGATFWAARRNPR